MKIPKCIFALSILLFACGPNDDDGTSSLLPDITTDGRNTFGCTIDGQIFLPRDAGGLNIEDPTPILKALYVYDEYYFNGYALRIFADNEILSKSITIEMTGSATGLAEGGIYPIILEENDNVSATYYFWDEEVFNANEPGRSPFFQYRTNNSYNGELEIIKLDLVNQIISGTFWFNCEETDNGEIVKIRDGRFDINYTIVF